MLFIPALLFVHHAGAGAGVGELGAGATRM